MLKNSYGFEIITYDDRLIDVSLKGTTVDIFKNLMSLKSSFIMIN
jgi:peptide subunit release factor 1 (eRF1)